MDSAISLPSNFGGDGLRILARQTKDADKARKLQALASNHDGGSRAGAARLGIVMVQIVHDWVVPATREGSDGLINGKAAGKPSLLNEDQRTAFDASH